MMMNSAVNFYPSPYGPTPYSGLSNNFGISSPPIPHYYNTRYAHHQSKAEPPTPAPPPPPQPQPPQPQPPLQPQSQPPSHQHHHHHHQQSSSQHQERPGSQQQGERLTSYKLYDLYGSTQSDIIRLIFAFVGVPYKDKRLKHEEWMKIKEQIPFQQLPILRVNNQFRICHLHAIIRYLAREYHLYGTGKHDHAIIDIITEIARQLQEKIFEQTDTPAVPPTPDQAVQELITDFALTYLKQFEELYNIFDRHGPFYLGSHISLADLIVYNTTNYLIKIDANLLENYSRLKEARRHLEKHPGIVSLIKGKHADPTKARRHRSPQGRRQQTKSPTPNANGHPPPPHHRGHHRHRSDERHKSAHHHHHHYHCPYHERRRSKEPTPFSQSKHQSDRSLGSPSLLIDEKEPVLPPSNTKPQVTRASKSPSSSRKGKEPTPPTQTKQRLIRSSISPSIRKPEKESTPAAAAASAAAATTDVQGPPPPPILKEHRSDSKAK